VTTFRKAKESERDWGKKKIRKTPEFDFHAAEKKENFERKKQGRVEGGREKQSPGQRGAGD